jgi:UDP-hydrolysing UDP-N-acetyl-D-glucosamine 2-epimerase
VRTVGVVTVGRSDYGILRPVMRAIDAHGELALRVYATAHGVAVDEIEGDGLRVDEVVEMLEPSDDPAGIAASMGHGTAAFGALYARERPDLLCVLGDRFEVHSAVAAAVPHTLPVAHVHGGDVTEGAFDDALRHSITKLSHLHFPATEDAARRILQMGEERWRVTVAGAPGLDNLREILPPGRDALGARLGFDGSRPFLLVTYHPVTLEHERVGERVDALLAALGEAGRTLVLTHPNADTGRGAVLERLEAFAAARDDAVVVDNAGTEAYFGLMAHADAMVGNSSSGIIEAASFELPVVNVGARQNGRLRAANVIDTGDGADEIAAGIAKATSPGFRDALRGTANPYGDGHASERIAARLAEVELGERLRRKRFSEGGD